MNDVSDVLARHKLDADAFRRMAEAGIIGWQDRIELIDGELIDMAPIGDDHAGAVTWLANTLFRACQGRVVVDVQNPIHLDDKSLPQPDFALYRNRADLYRSSPRPGPADTLVLIEVADSSLGYDSTVKRALYARFGIPEYWLVDLPNRRLLIHRKPGPEGYADMAPHAPGTPLVLAAAPEVVLDLGALFP